MSSSSTLDRRRPAAFTEFSNIRVLPSGYQVAVTRAKIEFSRHFAGHSDASLEAALRFRDKVLRQLPPKKLNPVPRSVLRAVGLQDQVVGVFRSPKRLFYTVSYEERGGKRQSRTFSWRYCAEAEAYAAAVAFRQEVVSRPIALRTRPRRR